jgi:hypothetical protein
MPSNPSSTALPAGSPDERIQKALGIAVQFGGFPSSDKKAWAIDQMVRALTGCPVASDEFTQGESPEYAALVKDACAGSDGPETYTWDTGICP